MDTELKGYIMMWSGGLAMLIMIIISDYIRDKR